MLKQLLQFRTLLLALLVMAGAGNVWGQTTVTLTQANLGLTGSYTTGTEKTIGGVTYVYTGLMKSNSNIQAKESTGTIYNKTSFGGDITRVEITHSGTARPTTILGSSDGTNWTQVATGPGSITGDFSGKGYKYFKITRGSNAAYWTKIEVTYTAAVPSFTITAQSNNSTWGTVSLNGYIITATPTPGYTYADPAYSVSPENSATVEQSGNQFIVTPSANTTVTINFAAIPTYTVTFADGGYVTEESGGAGVTLPSRDPVGAYTFAGWCETDVDTVTTTAPTIFNAGSMYFPTDNVTLYPVYSKTEGGGTQNKTASVTISDYATANSWSDGTQYTSVVLDENVTALGSSNGNNSKYYTSDTSWRFYASTNPKGKVTISVSNGTLTGVTFTHSGTLKYNNSDIITSGSEVSVSGTSAEFVCTANAKITAISVNYSVSGSTTTYWSYPVAAAMGETTLQLSPSNVNTPYGKNATVNATVSNGYDGTLTAKSSNDLIATASVEGITITIKPVAVGEATITVTAPETSTFSGEAKETINVTVTAPEGKTTAAVNGYGKVTSTSDLKSGEYLIVYEAGNVAFNGDLETLDGVSNTVAVTINNNAIAGSETVDAATFTIDVAAGTIKSASGMYIGVSSNSNGLNQSEEASTYTNSFSIDEDGNAVISAVFSGSTMSLRYNNASNQTRFRYYKSGQAPIALYKKTSLTATLNGSGYATYCSEYPLDFSNADDYSAWQVKGVDGNAITFEKVTGSVKGGTGLLLMGERGATVTLTSVDSDTELKTNLLKGTLAPTCVDANKYYGLSGKQFLKVNPGTVPAGKALLPANVVGDVNNVRTLSLVFVDPTTGIAETKTMTNEDAIYNLAGQRISKTQRGVNIVGGKKVLVK